MGTSGQSAEHQLGSRLNINIPNFITLGRVISVPIVFWLLLTGQNKAAFIVFVCAGISDAVDGYIAKRFNSKTELGAYLDPAADKLLIVSIYIALGAKEILPLWLVIIVVSRDILIVLAIMLSWLMNHPVHIRPIAISKMNTASQLILASLVLADEGFSLGWLGLRAVLVWITGILTVLSLAAYLKAWLMHMTGYEDHSAREDGTG